MPYRFEESDDTVESGLKRIAQEQIGQAMCKIDDKEMNVHDTVHEVRKHCKKVRGLVRLVRPAFKGYRDENQAFRDASRLLSFVRDSEALIETYDDLLAEYAESVDRRSFAPIRRQLTLRKKRIAQDGGLDEKLAAFREEMVAARKRSESWHLDCDGFDALAGGLAKTYGRAIKRMEEARKRPSDEALHEWRKRVKYHWYHSRLLRNIWPRMMKTHEDCADELSDLLGDHHDLAVFRETISRETDAFGRIDSLETLLGLIGQRQAVLEKQAFELGEKMLAEPKKSLVTRWRRYWEAWAA